MTATKRADTRTMLKHWREAVPEDRLAHLIKDAARALVRSLSVRLAEHEVSFGHWSFLRILWEGDGITQRALSEQAGVMEPTTFAAIKAMEGLGYVQRKRLRGNRKNVYVHLTRKGRALEKKLVPLARQVNAIGLRGLSAGERATVRRALLRIIDNLREQCKS